MCKLNGIKCLIILLAAVSGTASSDVIIDNQSIPGSDISSISISPSSGNIFVTTIPGYTVTEGSGEPPPPDDVAITTFSASPSTVTEGQSTTISWATQNATSCTPSNGTGGWVNRTIGLPNSSTNITLNTVGSVQFKLTCEGQNGPVERNRTVTVNPEPDPGSCEDPSLSGTQIDWLDFWLESFPMPGYDNRMATVPRTGYYALKFNTGSITEDGKMSSIETTSTDGVRLGSFSKCPGDFDVVDDCLFTWGVSGGLRWATNGRSGACQLEPNTNYYFNITYTNGVSGSSTSCNSSPCITTLQHVNQ